MTRAPALPLWRGRTTAVLALVLLALSLRSAVSAIAPITARIGADIPLTSVGLGVIGMLPPLFFAVSGLIAPALARRLGLEAALLLAIATMITGHIARALSGDYFALLLGSAVVLVGMGIANVLLPPAVKRYFPDRIGLMTATYATVMSLSTAMPGFFGAALADSMGWRFSIGVWSLLALIAAVPWALLLIRHRASLAAVLEATPPESSAHLQAEHDSTPELPTQPPHLSRRMWHSRVAWAITLAFAVVGINAYTLFAWLPEILIQSAGATPAEGGILLALFSIIGLPVAIAAPVLVSRMRNQGWIIQSGVVLFLLGYLGLIVAPATLTWLWVLLLGLGAVLFPVCLVLINTRTRSQSTSTALSGFVQGVGYAVAATGPLLVGLLHDISGGWTVPLLFLFGTAATGIVSGVILAKPTFVEDELR